MNFMVTALPVKSFARHAARADALVRRLDVLAVAVAAARYREERGRWPASVTALGEAGLVEEREAGAGARLEPGEGGALRVVAPLPRSPGDEREDAQVALVVPPPIRR